MLRKLSLHGFKSFCDRTEVSLGSGITAIVGPNGCGKSNLADALRWVLGEQNPRVLRSARSQDVIFAGTQSRKAMGMAEVRLLFDSISDGAETEITRRLARDGSGEYRLNGKVCRWKDVVETLAGTGLAHTGYVVIGQGTIQELASGKPEDRRAWIEEASGVAKVRLDKRDMESKLEAARADIARLEDLMFELASRKEQLAGDRETARQYQDLAKQRRELDLSMWMYQFDDEIKKSSSLKRRLEKCAADLRDADLAAPRLIDEEASLRQKREPLDARIADLTSRRESAAQELLFLEKKRDAARGQIVVLKREVDARTARKAAIERDLLNLATERQTLESRRVGIASEFELASAALRGAEEKRQSQEAARKELSEKVIGVRTDVVTLTGELGSAGRARDDFRRGLEEVRREKASLQEYLRLATLEREKDGRELASVGEQQAAVAASGEEARTHLRSLETRSTEVKSLLDREISSEKNLGARLSAQRARRKLLEDMERNFEGYGRGPRTILEAHAKGLLKGIQGSVGQLFSCETRYIPALSAAVGGAAEDIIVADETAAKSAIAHLKQMRGGRATFLPLSALRPRDMNPRAEAALSRVSGVRSLLSVVSYPSEMESAARYLVGRIVLAETLDVGLQFMRESAWTTRVVTLTGESIEPGGAISGGEAPRSEGLFRRKQELSEARENDAALSKELESVLAKRKALEREASSLADESAAARSETMRISTQASRLTETRMRLESQARTLERQTRERESQGPALSDREEKLTSEMRRVVDREKEIAAQMTSRQEILRGYESKMKGSLDWDRQFEGQIRKLISDKEGLERDLSAVMRRLEGLSGEGLSHRRSLEEEDKEIARQGSLLVDVEGEEKSLGENIEVLDRDVSGLAGEALEAESLRERLTARLSDVAREMERLARDKVTLASRFDEASAEVETTAKALQDIADLVEQEFGLTDLVEVDHPRVTRAEGLPKAEDLDNQLKALGGVNLKAEEEYADISDRIDLLTTEKADVLSAIEEINRAREIVEKEMETRFIGTFSLVASSFREIFQELFGGGKGDLVLIEGSLGVEVIAEPPGRRQKHLNLLSGGERSLCGIALIFAILSVKASPLIVLDEADTALDESNIVRFRQFLKRYAEDTQFLVITHQKATMEAAEALYGVTMEEPGVSRIFGMRLENR